MGKQQKIVMKAVMEDAEKRSKALQIATGLHGVVSAAIEADKDQIVVEGEVDSVALIQKLRKKFRFVELVSVTSVEEEKKKKEKEKKEKEEKEKKEKEKEYWKICPNYQYYPVHVIGDPAYDQYCCSIM